MTAIKRVRRIKGFPSFVDFKPSPGLPDFAKYNLIYGWNASGKTSFSRVLRCFELGECDDNPDAEFELIFDDDKVVGRANLSDFSNIRVFNRDFVSENIFCAGGPKPFFVLGRKDKESVNKLSSIEKELETLREEEISQHALLKQENEGLEKVRAATAKTIKDALTTSGDSSYRNYDKSNLGRSIDVNFRNEGALKSDENLQIYEMDEGVLGERRNLIHQEIKEEIDNFQMVDFDVSELVEETKKALSAQITAKVIEDLRADTDVNDWVKRGLEIHKERGRKDCAYCGQGIPQDRISALESHFSESYQNLMRQLEDVKGKVESRKDSLDLRFPDESRFYKDLQENYLSAKQDAEKFVSDFKKYLDTLISALGRKEKEPFSEINFDESGISAAGASSTFTKISDIIERHNKRSQNFEFERKGAKEALENHYIAEFIPALRAREKKIKDIKSDLQVRKVQIDEREHEAQSIRRMVRSHHIPADRINENLKRFLGRNDFYLKPAGGDETEKPEAYQIFCNGNEATGGSSLSEGERTALALVYFLMKLDGDGFDKSEGVVVIDDPISSMDSIAVARACAFIRYETSEVKQLFILTHHFGFFSQVKKWFDRQNDHDDEYFMMVCENEGSTRDSSVIKLDKLLADYDTEYHFLFSVLYRFSENGEKSLAKMYHLPNVARKFLEMFLNFKIPAKNSLYNQIMDMPSRLEDWQKDEIWRFVNDYSHSKFENGMQGINMSMLKQAPSAIGNILALVKEKDEEHYESLESLIPNRRA